MTELDLPGHGHGIGERFPIGSVQVELTPRRPRLAEPLPKHATRTFLPEDCCGFWITTPDGTIWAPATRG